MALFRCSSVGGGGSINPTIIQKAAMARSAGTMKTYTIDANKHYLLIDTVRYSDDNYRTNVYSVYNKTLTDMTNTYAQHTHLSATLDPTGTSLSITADQGGIYIDATLIQLD